MSIDAIIIDDDPGVTNLISLLVKGQGITITPASGGEEGLKLIRERNPDVVIIDLMMPGMDGWQVCKEIRKTSNVPIIIMSVLNDSSFIASALDAGADDYLVKPVTGGVLIAHINRLVRRAEAERTHKLMGTKPFPAPKQIG